MKKTPRDKIAQATVLLVGLEVLTAGAGLLRQMFVAAQFGTSETTDAYVAATSVVGLVQLWLIFPIRQVILPMFRHDLARYGEQAAWSNMNILLNNLIAVLVLVALAAWTGAPFLVNLITPGFAEGTSDLATALTRIMMLTLVLTPPSLVLEQILFSYERFFLPGITDLVNNVVTVVVLVLLGGTYGIYGLAAATVLGAVCELLSQLPILWEKRKLFRWKLNFRHPGMYEMGRLSLPLFLANGSTELARITDRIFASLLPPGSLSALAFGSRPSSILSDIVIDPVQKAIFPHFSKLSAEENFRDLARQHAAYLRALFFLTLPITIGLILITEPLVRILYQRGAFDETSVLLTSQAFACYMIGFPAIALSRAFNRVFLSFKDTWTPTKLSLIRIGVKILLAWILVRPFAHAGLALAESLSHIVRTGSMFFFLPSQLKEHDRWGTIKSFGQTLAACVLMGVPMYLVKGEITGLVSPPVELGVMALLGVVTYGMVIFLHRGEEAQLLLRALSAVGGKYLLWKS